MEYGQQRGRWENETDVEWAHPVNQNFLRLYHYNIMGGGGGGGG